MKIQVLCHRLLFSLLLLLVAVSASALDVGTTAPDFQVPDLDGKEVRLSDFKGRIIVLKLATTWCPSCSQQMAELREGEKFLKENNVAVVTVYLQDSREMVRRYQEKEGLSIPHAILIDNGRAGRAYNVYVIPRIVVIDKDFKVRRDGSVITEYDLRRQILRILNEEKG
jgi:peroxiredoxin